MCWAFQHQRHTNNKKAFASDIIKGKTLAKVPLTRELANKILDGFAADVLLANWDVIGLENDNILVDEDGNPARIDNGSSFSFRAQGARKPAQLLTTNITELEAFSNPNINEQYAEVFRTAGVSGWEDLGSRFVGQVANIAKAKKSLGGWKPLVQKLAPDTNEKELEVIIRMLDARTDFLIQKARELR
jgi:hypothetical protein